MTPSEGYVLVIGSAGLDIVGRAAAGLHIGTSNPSNLRTSFGGVARNVAENMARLGTDVVLITAVGDDPQGKQLLLHTSETGVNVDHALMVPDHPTGTYLAILDNQGNLHLGMDDMRVIVDPTGAGDALTAAVIFALFNEIPLDEAIRLGLSAAALTLRSPGTVATDLSLEVLYDGLR